MAQRSFGLVFLLALAAGVGCPHAARAETGYDLWLRYVPIREAGLRDSYRRSASSVAVPLASPTGRAIADELRRGLEGMLGAPVRVSTRIEQDGAVLVGTPAASPLIAGFGWSDRFERAGDEGFVIRSAFAEGRQVTVIASRSEAGALHGAFHFLRLLQTRQPIARLDIVERPRVALRLLDHWDNLDGSIERGYAGRSLWDWPRLPGAVDPRLRDYARANASIGINGTVLNNVNANPRSLTRPYLEKAAAIAAALRPYGVRIYLSANFAAPRTLGGLATADPLDPRVAAWWRAKAAEIYRLVPDFGGFLVKANSEGQPGPQDYGRTHADGANVLADALAPHGGVVMWRAFVYSAEGGPRPRQARLPRVRAARRPLPRERDRAGEERPARLPAARALQPAVRRDAAHAADGGTPGHAGVPRALEPPGVPGADVEGVPRRRHATHPAPARRWRGSWTGRIHRYRRTGMAGVANTGSDANWTGHHFGQANWYAYGRLAWNPDLACGCHRRRVDRDDVVGRRGGALGGPLADARVARGAGGLHDAARPSPPDWRRPLRADAREPRPAPRGLVRNLLPSGRPERDRVRPDAAGQRRRRSVPQAARRHLRTIRPRAPRTSCSGSTACRGTTELRSGGTLWEGLVRHYTRGAEAARGDGSHVGGAAGRRGRRALRGGSREAPRPGRRRRGLARQVPPVLPAVQRAEASTAREGTTR